MPPRDPRTILYLRLRNHPGALSHVCGLFARRAFNLERILCAPSERAGESTMLLDVAVEQRLDQVVRQLAKLEDVLEVRPAPEAGEAFDAADAALTAARDRDRSRRPRL